MTAPRRWAFLVDDELDCLLEVLDGRSSHRAEKLFEEVRQEAAARYMSSATIPRTPAVSRPS